MWVPGVCHALYVLLKKELKSKDLPKSLDLPGNRGSTGEVEKQGTSLEMVALEEVAVVDTVA